jgi:hypothetical protein
MKKLIIIVLFFMSFGVFAQGNLQFNRVITFTAGSNYTVPSGKVLKIESISTNGSNVSLPRTSTGEGSCRNSYNYGYVIYTYGIYNGITYLTIGNINFTTGNASGINLGPCFGGESNPDFWSLGGVQTPQIQVPLWLEAGKTLNIHIGTFQILISAIEFNIVP